MLLPPSRFELTTHGLPDQCLNHYSTAALSNIIQSWCYSAANFCFNKGLCKTWNEGALSKHKLSQKSCHGPGFQSPNRYESYLSNEILYALVGCTVPHLKDLIHICLETESQGYGMTFNMIYLRSKCPYFISYRGIF